MANLYTNCLSPNSTPFEEMVILSNHELDNSYDLVNRKIGDYKYEFVADWYNKVIYFQNNGTITADLVKDSTPNPPVTIYTATATGNFTPQCPNESVGTPISFTATGLSYVSQNDAQSKANAALSANGQAYANANGICTCTLEIGTLSIEYTGNKAKVTVPLLNGVTDAQFSIDNIVWQTSNIFSGLSFGSYTFYAKKGKCLTNKSATLGTTVIEPTVTNITSLGNDCFINKEGQPFITNIQVLEAECN